MQILPWFTCCPHGGNLNGAAATRKGSSGWQCEEDETRKIVGFPYFCFGILLLYRLREGDALRKKMREDDGGRPWCVVAMRLWVFPIFVLEFFFSAGCAKEMREDDGGRPWSVAAMKMTQMVTGRGV
ncbi:hypothetical protein LR48_Vigan06g053000 [Vigna angularis]|uniref:Uncharacterized protein n=1 Tax=Phaseolus angularis TaxID=3914 RepID=A0A0L9URR0_PHAAN|nr:uncharacterized protein HKW66_Vig0155790 [Vigna angularis]KOM45224.1 hypothetical protein LR48_Vigan06g053000 [Vigna angularis]